MKKLILLLFLAPFLSAGAQDTAKKIMDAKAREFYRVIKLDDREVWKKFIRENYSEEFINKPSSRRVMVDGEEKSETTATTGTDKVDAKADLFQMLHRDFGDSNLTSLTIDKNIATLVLSTPDGLRGTFTITHQQQAPYLIENMGVEADMNR